MVVDGYNLRVYGLLLYEQRVLITHENRAGMIMTKFPGGGLEMGEGLADCLIREFREELEILIQVGSIFYVNDFLQLSKFNETDQLISFYFMVSTMDIDIIPATVFLDRLKKDEQIFEWVCLRDIDPNKFTFPVDKKVAEKLAGLQWAIESQK